MDQAIRDKELKLAYLAEWIGRGGHGVLSLYKFSSEFPRDGTSRRYAQLCSHFMSRGAFNEILENAIDHRLVARKKSEESGKKERRYALTATGIEWARAVELAMRIDVPILPGRRRWRF